MQKEILEADDPGTIYMIVDKFGYKVDRKTLLQNIVSGVTNSEIKQLRETNRVLVFNHLREQLDEPSQNLHKKTSNPRLEFISRFLLYGGLVRYYNDMKVKDKSVLEAVKITAQSMDKYERDLMKIFNCDADWPVCLFDFSFKNKTPSYIALKVAGDLDTYIFEDYYFSDFDPLSL
jgi:hypothetical protein